MMGLHKSITNFLRERRLKQSDGVKKVTNIAIDREFGFRIILVYPTANCEQANCGPANGNYSARMAA